MLLSALPARGAALGPVPGEVIVQFRPGASLTRQVALSARATPGTVRDVLAERAAVMGTRLGRVLKAGSAVGERTQVLSAEGLTAAELAARLAADPDVEFAVPNGRARRTAAPNDPLYPVSATERRSNGIFLQDGPASGQWYLRAPAATLAQGPVSSVDIERAWARSRGSASVVVAVLDTGVRPEHPDLAGRLLPGYDFISNATVANDGGGRDADPADPGDWVTLAESSTSTFTDCSAENSSWHGTKTTALVGASADNAVGMAGTAPGVSVLPVRVLGKCFGSESDIWAAMKWAAGISIPGVPDNPTPAKVLNLSLGGVGSCSAGYQAAVDEVLARGAVIVAAAGNSAGGPVGAPANCVGVIGVAALRHAGLKVGFSDLGPQISIAAPGGNCINITAGSPCLYPLVTATNSGTQGPVGNGTWTSSYDASVGTSFASPLVAATAGLMFSAQPALTPALLLARMQATARPFPTTGGDNSIVPPLAVRRCDEPNRFNSGTDPNNYALDLQCYCTTGVCGAGMLDSGEAVRAVVEAVAKITVSTAAPTAGSPVLLSGTASLPPPVGAQSLGYSWSLVDGGGVVTAFDGEVNASTARLIPSAAGTFTVQLTVTDAQGITTSKRQSVTVAAAPALPPATGGGGGATSAPWLALLTLAVAALFRDARRQRRA
ncbi:MAG: peptidase [Leptothrix sp. (in: Bacteria)]|nr:peptidase [Leptothrix sp. (in: b-proteobacteria)]